MLSYDGVNSPEALAITAAGAALLISEIPMDKAIAGVKVGYVNGKFLVNPSVQDQVSRWAEGSTKADAPACSLNPILHFLGKYRHQGLGPRDMFSKTEEY